MSNGEPCKWHFKDYVHVPEYIPGIEQLTEEVPVSDDIAIYKAIKKSRKKIVAAVVAALSPTLEQILAGQKSVAINQEIEMTALTDLQAAVAAEDNEIAAAVTFIQGVPALVAQAVAAAQAGDTTGLAAITTDIQAQTAAVAAALAPAVPVAPAPPAATPAP